MNIFHNPIEKWIIVVLVSIMVLLGFKSVKADHNESIFFQTTAPILCASYDDMTKWLEHNDFEIVSVGIGRKGGVPDGEPVYMIQGYKKKDKDVFVSSVETPDGVDKCLMYNLFDYKRVEELEKGFK